MNAEEIYTLTIDGKGVATATASPVLDPATQAVIGLAPIADGDCLDAAIVAARGAFGHWRDAGHDVRARSLLDLADAIAANLDDLSRLLTLEQGKPLARAREEVMGSAFWLRSVAARTLPESVNEETADRRSITRRVPFGVVAAIVPWNFPLLLAVWKLAPALLAGNCVVLKPSPFTPLTALKLGKLARGILPDGVFNVLSGGDDLGPRLVEHELVDMVALTGSSRTGQAVMRTASAGLKRLMLELGGNDAAIVLEDADIAVAAARIFQSAFSNAGQVCVATKRVYVHDSVFDAFFERMVAHLDALKVGPGHEDGVEMGPVQNLPQYQKVTALIDRARSQGLALRSAELRPGLDSGLFIAPVLVMDPPWDSEVMLEEAFGPVLPIVRFRDAGDVIAHVNAGEHGLGGSIWSSDLGRATALAHQLQTGMVTINEGAYLAPWVPFAGHRQSGLGVENGQEGLLAYTQPQTLTTRLT